MTPVSKLRFFFKNPAVSPFLDFGPLTPYRKSKKSYVGKYDNFSTDTTRNSLTINISCGWAQLKLRTDYTIWYGTGV